MNENPDCSIYSLFITIAESADVMKPLNQNHVMTMGKIDFVIIFVFNYIIVYCGFPYFIVGTRCFSLFILLVQKA